MRRSISSGRATPPHSSVHPRSATLRAPPHRRRAATMTRASGLSAFAVRAPRPDARRSGGSSRPDCRWIDSRGMHRRPMRRRRMHRRPIHRRRMHPRSSRPLAKAPPQERRTASTIVSEAEEGPLEAVPHGGGAPLTSRPLLEQSTPVPRRVVTRRSVGDPRPAASAANLIRRSFQRWSFSDLVRSGLSIVRGSPPT